MNPKTHFFPLNPFSLTVKIPFGNIFRRVEELNQERQRSGAPISQIGAFANSEGSTTLSAQAVDDEYLAALRVAFGDCIEAFHRPSHVQAVYTNVPAEDFQLALMGLEDTVPDLSGAREFTQLAMRRDKGLCSEKSALYSVSPETMKALWDRRSGIFRELLALKGLDTAGNPVLLIFYNPPGYEGSAGKLKGWPSPAADVEKPRPALTVVRHPACANPHNSSLLPRPVRS